MCQQFDIIKSKMAALWEWYSWRKRKSDRQKRKAAGALARKPAYPTKLVQQSPPQKQLVLPPDMSPQSHTYIHTHPACYPT